MLFNMWFTHFYPSSPGLQAGLQGGVTSCQNCVKSLPRRQVLPLASGSSFSAFSFSSTRFPKKFQFLGDHCFSSLIPRKSWIQVSLWNIIFLPRGNIHRQERRMPYTLNTGAGLKVPFFLKKLYGRVPSTMASRPRWFLARLLVGSWDYLKD